MLAKFRYTSTPKFEHTLSGWNCTPWCGLSRCDAAMITPPLRSASTFSGDSFAGAPPPSPPSSSVHAVARRHFGNVSASTTRL